jgi:hypothetical protein
MIREAATPLPVHAREHLVFGPSSKKILPAVKTLPGSRLRLQVARSDLGDGQTWRTPGAARSLRPFFLPIPSARQHRRTKARSKAARARKKAGQDMPALSALLEIGARTLTPSCK